MIARALLLLPFAQTAAASAPAAPPVEISADGPREPVELGKPFALTVHRSWAKGGEPDAWSDAALAPLVVKPRGVERREENGRVVESRRFDASAFAPGSVDVPALHLRFEVKGVLGEPAGAVEPPPGPYDAPFDTKRALWIAAAALAAAALAFAIVRRLRRKRAAAPSPVAPRIPPDERALARLAVLRRWDPATTEEVQRYYVEASAVAREYIEERFRVHAPEMTTEEFLSSEATSRALDAAHRSLLAEFLSHCDLVKFGRHASTRADRERLLGAAEQLVRETRIDLAKEPAMSAAGAAP